MSYDRETYEKVENRLYEMRLKAADDLEKKKQIFYSRFPRAKEIEKSLGLMSVGIAKAVLKGRDVKEALESLKKESEKLKEELAEIILHAGLPKNYLEPDFACKLCNDEGFIDGKMCVCMKNLLKKEAYKKLSDMAPVSGCSFRGFSLDYYPDEHAVYFCDMGADGEYRIKEIPLFELDRQNSYSAATCCIVPPAASQDKLDRGDMNGLMAVLRRLRAPGGCPWDAKQTHESLRSGLIEEAYEVIDAIDSGDPFALCEELGDLLLHVGMHTVIEEERSSFTLRDVTSGIINKMIYRHPHVFGTAEADTPEQVLSNWEKLKKKEKHMESYSATMEAVPKGFPALMRAAKIQKKAANVGFDWDNADQALYKLPEEVSELTKAMAEGNHAHIDEELGDVFFAAVNVARLLKRDPEQLLNAATDKFITRFKVMEELITADSLSLEDMTLEKMDRYWDKAKKKLK